MFRELSDDELAKLVAESARGGRRAPGGGAAAARHTPGGGAAAHPRSDERALRAAGEASDDGDDGDDADDELEETWVRAAVSWSPSRKGRPNRGHVLLNAGPGQDKNAPPSGQRGSPIAVETMTGDPPEQLAPSADGARGRQCSA
jgi:hypothetical protein